MESALSIDGQLALSLLSSLGFNIKVVIGAFVIWIFSWLWHDFIAVKPWLRWTGMTIDDAKALHKGKLNQHLGIYLVSKIFLSYFCMFFAAYLGVNTVSQVGFFGTAISLGVVFSSGIGPVIFENRNIGLWFLSSMLTSISVFALLILQSWMPMF